LYLGLGRMEVSEGGEMSEMDTFVGEVVATEGDEDCLTKRRSKKG